MKFKSVYQLTGVVFAMASIAVFAQTPATPQRTEQAAAQGAAVQPQAPSMNASAAVGTVLPATTTADEKARYAAAKRRGPNESFRPRGRQLLYALVPGSLEQPGWSSGVGIVVLDVNDNYRFVKRIPTWDYSASMSPEQVAGVAASPVTNMIYPAARGRIAGIDLATDKMVWSTELDGKCCERPQVTPDGKTIVVGSDLQNYWYSLDAMTGKLRGILEAPESLGSHNLNLSADGKTAFMSPNGKIMTVSDVESRKIIRTIRFPENIRVFVVNKDSSKIYTNQQNFLGYSVADVATGKIEKTVEVTSVDWRPKWDTVPRPRIPHGCPSHGIALTHDESEVWVADGMFNKIHIFSNTADPKQIATIDTSAGPFWMTFGLDGKLVYASSGDVIDVKSRKIIAKLKDELGRSIHSEKVLDILFQDGHAQRVSNQFGNGYGDAVTAEKLGVGPKVTPKPGAAPITMTLMK